MFGVISSCFGLWWRGLLLFFRRCIFRCLIIRCSSIRELVGNGGLCLLSRCCSSRGWRLGNGGRGFILGGWRGRGVVMLRIWRRKLLLIILGGMRVIDSEWGGS